MKQRAFIILALLAAIVLLPMLLRRESATVKASRADDRLVILTPHNESIRQEFGEAFAAWWKQSTGRTIHVDWRSPGGTSEIRMVLDAAFKAAVETGRDGIGIDVFFGGGEPDFAGQAKKGRLVPLRVFTTSSLRVWSTTLVSALGSWIKCGFISTTCWRPSGVSSQYWMR